MNRNEAIDKLTEAGRDAFGIESLQSRIEMLDMKFETEDALLETVGSLRGGNRNDLEPTIRKILSVPDSHDWYQICDEVRLVHKQASDLHQVTTLLLEWGAMGDHKTVLGALKQLVEQKEELTQIKEFASRYSHLGKERVTQVITRLAKSAQQHVKTYWDGVEPLRVGHITADGEVATVLNNGTPVYNYGDHVITDDHPQPHPFAKYTEQEREFLQSQIEAGVIKLC